MFEVGEMNEETRVLFEFFNKRFPTAGKGIFKITVEAKIKGGGLNEDFRYLTKNSALRLKSLYSGISEDDLAEWVFGLLMREPKGICQQAIEEM